MKKTDDVFKTAKNLKKIDYIKKRCRFFNY